MKVFMLPSYQSRAPSTRMRVNKIADFFQKENQPVEVLPFDLSIEEKHKRLSPIQPTDILYVQKWRTEFNSAEHLIRYKGKCKIVFDLDDLTGDQQALGLIGISDAMVVGNHYLFKHYASYRKPIFLVPTSVDLSEYPKFKKEMKMSIGIAKCGLGPMIKPLLKLKEILHTLHSTYDCTLFLAGFNNANDKATAQQVFPFAKCYDLLTYDAYLKNTVPILQMCTVGILPFAARDNGKSGHSALANLGMGLPTIVAPYAECDYIIEDGKNGFIAKTPKEWFEKIEKLFIDEQLRQQFRQAGWMTIIDKYDVPVIGRKLLKHLKEI